MFKLNTHVTNLSSAFSYNKVNSVGAGLFRYIKYNSGGTTVYPLTNVTSMFAWMPSGSLANGLPYNLFMYDNSDSSCINITSFDRFLVNASSFTGFKTGAGNYTLRINFPANNQVTSLSRMFLNCSSLQNVQDNSTLKDFFDNFTKATDISLVFATVNDSSMSNFVKKIPEGVFAACTQLVSIHGAFANMRSLEELPAYLFDADGSSTKYSQLTKAAALFAGCTSLKGYLDPHATGELASIYRLPKTLFYGAKNIKTLGRLIFRYSSTSNNYLPGAFANTAIQGIDIDFFDSLPELTDISLLFAKGTVSGNSFTITNTSINANKLKAIIFDNATKVNTDGLIPVSIFKLNNKLADVSYVFAGNIGFTGFGAYDSDTHRYEALEDTSSVSIFNATAKTNTITQAQGLFAYCSNLSCNLPNYIFTDCKKLTTVEAAFAGCSSLIGRIKYATNAQEEDDPLAVPPLLKGCSALRNAKKLFYQCTGLDGTNSNEKSEILPSKLFADCKGSLTTVEGLFFGCSSLKGCFEPKFPELITEGTYTTVETIKAAEEGEDDLKYDITIVLNQPQEVWSEGRRVELTGTGTFSYKQRNIDGAVTHTENISYAATEKGLTYKNELVFDATNIATLDSTTYTLYISYAKGDYILSKEVAVDDSFSTVIKTVKAKFTVEKPGLLSDCLKLTTAQDMFAGCTGLFGAIPQDIFFSSTDSTYNSLQNISGMFKFCNCLGLLENETAVNRENVFSFEP